MNGCSFYLSPKLKRSRRERETARERERKRHRIEKMCITVVHNRQDLNDIIVQHTIYFTCVCVLLFFFHFLLCVFNTQKAWKFRNFCQVNGHSYWNYGLIAFQVAKNINHFKNEFFIFLPKKMNCKTNEILFLVTDRTLFIMCYCLPCQWYVAVHFIFLSLALFSLPTKKNHLKSSVYFKKCVNDGADDGNGRDVVSFVSPINVIDFFDDATEFRIVRICIENTMRIFINLNYHWFQFVWCILSPTLFS